MPLELDKIHKGIVESLGGKINPKTKKAYTEEELWAIANTQYKKSQGKEEKVFCGQLFSVKETGDTFYTTFLLATDHPDNAADEGLGVVGDIIPKSTLEDMANQWNTRSSARKGSIHHKRGYEIPSVGVPGAKVIDLADGHHGLLVTSKANRHFSDKDNTGYDYNKFIGEVQDGILDAVSIEYNTNDFDLTSLDGKSYRILKNLTLHGYGHATRPLNEHATVLECGFKELNIEVKELLQKEDNHNHTDSDGNVLTSEEQETNQMEEKNMTEETQVAQPEAAVEVQAKETKEETISLSKQEIKELMAMKMQMEQKAELEKKAEELKLIVEAKVDERLKEFAPFLGGANPFESKEMPEVAAYKEAIKAGNTDMMFEAAGNLVDAIGAERVMRRSVANESKARVQNFECKGSMIVPKTMEVKEMMEMKGMEYKTLTTTSNAEATYYQASAELNDIYEPAIYSQLNDRSRVWGMLQKVSYADRALIEFRVRSARNAQTEFYTESSTTFTAGQGTRVKVKQDFALARAICQISGLEIASNQGRGGLGNIWAIEIQEAAVDLAKYLNSTLLTGAAGTYDGSAQDQPLGFQHLIATSGTIFGKDRGTYDWLKGQYQAMSDAEISIGTVRSFIRAVRHGTGDTADADKRNLVIFTSPTQRDKILSQAQSMQMLLEKSARIGFEGEPSIDTIPVVEDPDMDADDFFLIDMSHTKVGIKLAPTLTDLYLADYDGKKAFIRTYFNLYCTKPKNNYWASGFKTT